MAPGAAPAGQDWLDYRLYFFLSVALPSVRSQVGATFTWLVLFDDRCSDDFRADIEELAADGSFVPLWSHADFQRDSFADAVAKRRTAPYLITTRMDSDDGIARDYLAAVQAQFAGQELMFVNFTRGLQLGRDHWVYRQDRMSGAFLSLIEHVPIGERPRTVFAAKHARVRGMAPLMEVRSEPMTLMVVHGTNISNALVGLRTSARQLDRYDVSIPHDQTRSGPRLWAHQGRQLCRLARLWVRKPGELVFAIEGAFVRLRGTHVRPINDGTTWSETLALWSRRVKGRLRHSTR